MISWNVIKGFLRKEFKQTLRDPRMRILLFVAPLIQLIVFGVAISTDVRNIRIWSPFQPNDTVLQHIYEHCLASEWFLPSKINTNEDAFDLLRAGKIDVALIPPPGGLTKALGRGNAQLQVLLDATNVIQAQSVEAYIKTIGNKVVQDDFKIIPQNMPVDFVTRVLFNPNLETAYFMVPGVMCILITLATVILTSMSITREKEMGTFEMLISAPISPLEVILGKTIPYIIIGLCDVPLILAVAVFVFHVPMLGSLWVLLLAAFVYICSTVAIGILISTFAKTQQQATIGGFLFLFPAILLSGLMFPLENMPTLMKWISYLDPIAHFLYLVRNIMLKGGDLYFILTHVGILIGLASIFIYISYKRFHTTLT